MQEIQPKQRTSVPRFESVNDPDVNRALFTLYNNLIEPLTDIENMVAAITSARKTQEKCGTVITYSRSQTAIKALRKSPLVFIFLTVFMIIFYGTVINWILENYDTPKILDPILDPPMPEIFLVFAIISIIISFVVVFFWTASDVAVRNRDRREAYNKATDTISRLEPELKQQVFHIKDAIQFVPPKYRSSASLSYFVEAYSNSQVDNLKEAVNAYETYYFRRQTVEIQQQMLEQVRKNGVLLEGIYFQQLVTMQQLENIQRDIWLSSTF